MPGVYGTLGVFAAANTPGGREGAASWVDSSGNLWLFGGGGDDGNGNSRILNDLWEFNPSTVEWAWMGGSSKVGLSGAASVYGTIGIPAAGNIPGSRATAASWIDSGGHFWLFGGSTVDSSGNDATLNDVWEFNPSTGQWTWMGGSTQVDQPGVYGTEGVSAAANIPSNRYAAATWADSIGNLWLFGGYAFDVNGPYVNNASFLNDLWKYQPATASPIFSPAAGTYATTQSVTISSTTPDSIIYFTIDGTTPTTSSTVFTSAITVSSNETLSALAVASGYADSPVATAAYVIAAAPTLIVTPTNISFPAQTTGTISSIQTSTLTNSGNAALAITSVAATGDFTQTNNCGTSLAAGAKCTISVTFTPTAVGTRTGTVSIADNASGSPQTIALSGTGTLPVVTAPAATLTPTSLTFASQIDGTTSAAQIVTLSNSGTAALTIASITASGDFALTQNCGTSLGTGAVCTISVTFTPTTAGARTGTVTITDNAADSPQTISLSGGGEAFSISSASTGITISSVGGSGTAAIQLSSINGFAGTVNLACSVTYLGQGTPTNPPTCSLSPAQAQVSSSSPLSSTLTIATTSATAHVEHGLSGAKWTLASVFLFGLLIRRRSRKGIFFALCLSALWSILLTGPLGCGGSSGGSSSGNSTNAGTTTGSYQVIATATSGTVTASTTIPISVQ